MTNPCEGWYFPIYTQLLADDSVGEGEVPPGMVAVLVDFFDGDESVYSEPVLVNRRDRRMQAQAEGELLKMRHCDPTKYMYIESFVVNHVCGFPGADNRGA